MPTEHQPAIRQREIDNSIEHALLAFQGRLQKLRFENETAVHDDLIAGLDPFQNRRLAAGGFADASRDARRIGRARSARRPRPDRSPAARHRRESAAPACALPTGISALASISGRSTLFGLPSSMRTCITRVSGSNCWPRFVILPGEARALALPSRKRSGRRAVSRDLPGARRRASRLSKDRRSRT